MFAIYYGEDDYSRSEVIRALRDRLGEPEMASLNTTVLTAADARPAEAIAQAGAVPFLAPGRLVVIEGLLGQFEGRRAGSGSGRRRGRGAAATQEEADEFRGWGALKDAATRLPETNMLVLSDGPLNASNPLLRHLAPAARVREFHSLRRGALVDWIRRRVAAQGGRIAPEAVRALAESCGSNLWALDAEIAKLVLYASGDGGEGRPITRDDAEALVADVREETMFALVDDVVEGHYPQARARLRKLLEAGAATGQVIVMVGTQLRRLIAAKDLTARHAPRQTLEEGIGTRSDFALRKAVTQSERFSSEQLLRMHRRLLDYDLAIKTGEIDDGTALELLLAELCGVE